MDERDREELIEQLVARYRESLRRQLSRDPRTITQIEQVVEDVSQEMDRDLEQAILDRQPTPEDHENQACCPTCGGRARYRGVVDRLLITRHGERALRRRYYHCSACQRGFAPLDGALGLDGGATTPTVRGFAAQLGAHLPFAAASRLLEQLTGVGLGASTVERVTVAVGAALREREHAAASAHRLGQEPAVLRKPRRLYISVDGILAPLREAWRRDGSAGALSCRFGECKTATVYEARATRRGDVGVRWRAYTATFGKVETFGPLVATLAHAAGHHFARELIFLADGGTYNWSVAAAHFPEATQIVDFMHAVGHLFGAAQAAFGETAAEVGPWVSARKAELLADGIKRVIAAIEMLPAKNPEAVATLSREAGYFTRNAERMLYGTFRAQGYQIGSGVMEAGCKQVVHQRLDQVGMHWRQPTAEAVVALRAGLLSANPPDLRTCCLTAH
jgi:hypothetical protein